jgi:hypothetical protein
MTCVVVSSVPPGKPTVFKLAEIKNLPPSLKEANERLGLISARLGTPFEGPGDLEAAVHLAHQIRSELQILLMNRELLAI